MEQGVSKNLKKPAAVDHGNRLMSGVDIFDQRASGYCLLRRSKEFTRVLFYDMLEIRVINSFKLMEAWMVENLGAIALTQNIFARLNCVRTIAVSLAALSSIRCHLCRCKFKGLKKKNSWLVFMQNMFL